MKITAVICELNPLHNGHAYLFRHARELTHADAVLAVMSGNFVQRAEPAVLDMRARAKAALLCGADAVIELPVIYATACGQRFAQGAVNIINSIPAVTQLVFGSESGDLDLLKALAKVQSNESAGFQTDLKRFLDTGDSYPAALSKATAIEAGLSAPRLPNDILAVEYLKQLYKTDSSVIPLVVKRVGAGFHDKSFRGEFSSATAIRRLLQCENFQSAKQTMPQEAFEILDKNAPVPADYDRFRLLVVHTLRSRDLSQCPDAGEGLEGKLKKAATQYTDLDKIIKAAKSKRYTEARIRRLCLQGILGITHYPDLSADDGHRAVHVPAKLIGVKDTIKNKLLSVLPDNIIIKNKDFERYCASLSPRVKTDAEYIRNINKTAAGIYSLITCRDGERYDGERLLTI